MMNQESGFGKPSDNMRCASTRWLVVALAGGCLVAGCSASSTTTHSLTKAEAAASFRSAFATYSSRYNEVLQGGTKIALPDGRTGYGRPSASEDDHLAAIVKDFRNKLTAVAWPSSALQDAQSVEAELGAEVSEIRSVAGVGSSNPQLGIDYRKAGVTEKAELKAEDQLRSRLGLPAR
jgi:hypothetical protein